MEPVWKWLRSYLKPQEPPNFNRSLWSKLFTTEPFTSSEAKSVLATFYRDSGYDGKTYPIPLEEIIEWLEIDLKPSKRITWAITYLDSSLEKPTIYFAPNIVLDNSHLKFSIAHQIGHLILDELGLHDCFDTHSSNVERRANNFAADLLLPMDFVYPHGMKYGFYPNELGKCFGVSEAMAYFQIKRYGIYP